MVNFKPIFKSKHINGFSGDESISEQEMSILNAHPYLPLEVLRIIDAWNFMKLKVKLLKRRYFILFQSCLFFKILLVFVSRTM